LILIPNPLWGRLSALFVSGTVLIVGILMVFRARKLEQRERNQSVLGTSEEI